MSEYKFIIQGRLVGFNEYIDACKRNRYAANEMKKEQEKIVAMYILSAKLKDKMLTPVRLHIDWYEPNVKRDIDNIMAANKFILDAMRTMGVIPNDGQRHIKGIYGEVLLDRKNPRIEVRIKN